MGDAGARTEWSGRYLEILVDGRWEYVRRARGIGAAVILATTDAGELVLVEQYRVPLGRPCIELPAGLVGDEEEGDDARRAAERELLEETGFRAGEMEEIGRFCSSPGMTSESFTLFRARGLVREHKGGGTDGEDIAVHLVPADRLAAFLAETRERGAAVDAKLIGCLRLI